MPTLTTKQRKNISQQLKDIQGRINEIKKAPQFNKTPLPIAPQGEVLGATTDTASSKLKDFSIKSAGGITQQEVDQKNLSTKKLSQQLAQNYYGGTDSAKAATDAIKKKSQMDQTSANTSFSFNPDILNRTQRAVDKFGFALDEIGNDPFEPKEFKKEQSKNALNVTSKEIAGLFDNSDQLYQAFQTNKPFQDSLANFIKQGGTLNDISRNITAPMTVDNMITNQMVDNGELPESSREIYPQNTQSASDYLAGLTNPNADKKAEKMALDQLAPESDIAQAEIARQAGIPDQLRSLYFGDEKTMGLLQVKRAQATERIRIAEEQERDDKRTAKQKADVLIDKSRAEADAAESEIEENRLAAKNYMTAQLAKLGALKTTGAAVLAVQTLDAKYSGKITAIKSAFKLGKRAIEVELNEKLDKIENDADYAVLKIEEDLTLDSEKSYKEILKARNEADKEIYSITEQYARRLRERTEEHTNTLKKEAKEYAKEYARKVALAGVTNGFNYLGKPNKNNRIVQEISAKLQAAKGPDGKYDAEAYYAAYQEWIAAGGTPKTFTANFEPSTYVTTQDDYLEKAGVNLPQELKYRKPSQTISQDDTSDDDMALFKPQ